MRLSESEFQLVANFVNASTRGAGPRHKKQARAGVIRRLKRSSPAERVEIYGGMTRWLAEFNAHMVTMQRQLAQAEYDRKAAIFGRLPRLPPGAAGPGYDCS